MDELTLDADVLLDTAEVIGEYCDLQKSTIEEYYANIMSLQAEWCDDDSFGSMVADIASLKARLVSIFDEIRTTYPQYFREKAQYILTRPVIGALGATSINGNVASVQKLGGDIRVANYQNEGVAKKPTWIGKIKGSIGKGRKKLNVKIDQKARDSIFLTKRGYVIAMIAKLSASAIIFGLSTRFNGFKEPTIKQSISSSIDTIIKSSETLFELNKQIKGTRLEIADLTVNPDNSSNLPDKSEILEYKGIKSASRYKDKAYQKQSVKSVEKMEWQTRQAFKKYSELEYIKINNLLRGKKTDFISEFQRTDIEQQIEKIGNELNEAKLPQKMMLYRGVSSPEVILGKDYREKTLDELRTKYNGQIVEDKGFCSTSIDRKEAEKFAYKQDGTVLDIVAPKAANAICMGNLSSYKTEKEVLLQKGSFFKITGIDYDGVNYAIHMELVGRRK